MFARSASFSAAALAVVLLSACGRHAAHPSVQIALVRPPAGSAYEPFGREAAGGLAECRRQSGATVSELPAASESDYETSLVLLATENTDNVIAIGYPVRADLWRAARRFENVHFTLVDATVNLPNVNSIAFDVSQGAFLAGALAAMVSKTHHVAFVGGSGAAPVRASLSGFAGGVREVDPGVRVSTRFLGTYTDRSAADRAAAELAASGADVIFVVAGSAGAGAIDAAARLPGTFAIGSEVDQDALAPGKVLTSVVKRVDVAALRSCLQTVAEKPASGTTVLGLAEGGVALTDFRYTKGAIGAARLARLDRIRRAIVDGALVPPSNDRALAAFKPVPVP